MTDAETRDFVDGELANLPMGPAEDPVNFVEAVVAFLQEWATTYSVQTSLERPAYCCFVKCDRVAQVVRSQEGFSLQRYFRDDTPQDLLGRVYLCSPTLQTVYSKVISTASIDAVEQEIGRLGLPSEAIVIFNAPGKKAFWRAAANTKLSPLQVGAGTTDELRTEDFDKELTRFHVECTATPQGFARPWKSAKKLLTKDDLELEIRDHLCLFLKLQYKKSLMVDRETFEPTGRADLRVYFISERVSFFIELKVLRAVKRSGSGVVKVPRADTVNWGKKGIAQAYGYRLANDPSGVAYACCYDARGKNLEIKALVTYAESKNVRYRRYFMYQSAEAFQRSLMN